MEVTAEQTNRAESRANDRPETVRREGRRWKEMTEREIKETDKEHFPVRMSHLMKINE